MAIGLADRLQGLRQHLIALAAATATLPADAEMARGMVAAALDQRGWTTAALYFRRLHRAWVRRRMDLPCRHEAGFPLAHGADAGERQRAGTRGLRAARLRARPACIFRAGQRRRLPAVRLADRPQGNAARLSHRLPAGAPVLGGRTAFCWRQGPSGSASCRCRPLPRTSSSGGGSPSPPSWASAGRRSTCSTASACRHREANSAATPSACSSCCSASTSPGACRTPISERPRRRLSATGIGPPSRPSAPRSCWSFGCCG